MKIAVSGTAQIKMNDGTVVEILPNEIDFDAVGGDERGMGPSTTYQAIYEHENGDTVTWTLVEYPVGMQNHAETEPSDGVTVIVDFDYRLEHQPED